MQDLQSDQPVRGPSHVCASFACASFACASFALAACLLGCGSQSASAPPARSAPAAAGARPGSSPPLGDEVLRDLGPDATFADLVRTARALAKQSSPEPAARCLLSEAAPGYPAPTPT